MSPWISSLSTVALVAALLVGCSSEAPKSPPKTAPSPSAEEPVEVELSKFNDVEDEVHYYISRLPDRGFVETYGAEEHPRPWYIAAERLGQIGEPAIALLASRLNTLDEYELMLVLYALMLASQDPAVLAVTGGDYVELGTVLDSDHNAENRAKALAWWQRHGWRWQ
jgi:hypothetical protein